MATPNFVAAWKGTITLGGTQFNALQFNIKESAPLEDITYTQAAGATWQVNLAGYNRISGSVQFVYDGANQPTIAPFDMRAGKTLAAILTPDGTKPWSGTIMVSDIDWSSGPQAGTACKATVTFQGTGTWTEPTS